MEGSWDLTRSHRGIPSRSHLTSPATPAGFDVGRIVGSRAEAIPPRSESFRAGQRRTFGGQESNNYFTEMCSGSEAGSYLRRIVFVSHSTLGSRVIKKKKKDCEDPLTPYNLTPEPSWIWRCKQAKVWGSGPLPEGRVSRKNLRLGGLDLCITQRRGGRGAGVRRRGTHSLRTTTLQKCAVVPRRARI